MTILVCAPHPDDEMIGMGGTIAKFVCEGRKVVVVIFSLGEGSHPWQKHKAITTTRQREAIRAGKIAGTNDIIFLKLKDLVIGNQIVENNTEEKFASILLREKPLMVFMPALDDIHHDHRSVARFVQYAVKKYSSRTPVWQYTVWNPLFIINRNQPRMVIDITKYFSVKWNAIQCYESQRVSTFQLIPTVILRGLINGFIHKMTMAEVFLKAP